jgi:hypothetical protein
VTRAERRPRRWVAPLLAGAGATLTGVLAVATNIATGLLPDSWTFARNPVLMWGVVGALLMLLVSLTIWTARSSHGAGSPAVADDPAPNTTSPIHTTKRDRTFDLYEDVPPTDSTVIPLPGLGTFTSARLFVLTVSQVSPDEINWRNNDSTQIYIREGAAAADGTPIGHYREIWRYETNKEVFHPQWVDLPTLLGPVVDLVIYRPYDGPSSSPVPYRVTAVLHTL